MKDDAELLRRYVESRSEPGFTVLVERHLDLVYQAALRRTGGRSDLAQDAAQQVFTTLAREAPKLVSHPAEAVSRCGTNEMFSLLKSVFL